MTGQQKEADKYTSTRKKQKNKDHRKSRQSDKATEDSWMVHKNNSKKLKE